MDPEYQKDPEEDLYHYYFTESDAKKSKKAFKVWLEKAKKVKDWKPKRKTKKPPLSDVNENLYLFESDHDIKKHGYDWIYDELKEDDIKTL